MKPDTIDRILEEARALEDARGVDWHDYERFKRRIDALLGFTPERDRAIDRLLEALQL